MGFKRLVINNKAVSSVIGVILLVAITVIPAAAIESSVFGQETAQSVTKANLDTQAAALANVAAYDSPTSYALYAKLENPFGRPFELTDLVVFEYGTGQSAPLANLHIQSGDTFIAAVNEVPERLASVKVEHCGGDSVNFADTSTRITVSVNGSASDTILPSTVNTSLGVLNVGDEKILKLKGMTTGGPTTTIKPGSIVNIKIIDIKTSKIICDKDVIFFAQT